MSSTQSPVIVFGPTGNVGSVVASTAAAAGRKTILAMRDPRKSIPGLNVELERVQADLQDPSSVAKAIKDTGARRAFIYMPEGTQDGLKDSLRAMREAGLEFVVFLSSYSITGRTRTALEALTPDDIIPYAHGQVEMNLQDIFGKSYVALRCGAFATNTLGWKYGVKAGEVRLYRPDLAFDYITPGDMGRVGGTILAGKDAPEFVYLTGPKQISQSEAVHKIAKAAQKDIKVTQIDYETGLEELKKHGVPAFLAEYLMKKQKSGGYVDNAEDMIPEGSGNVNQYSGKRSETFDEWLESNKVAFA